MSAWCYDDRMNQSRNESFYGSFAKILINFVGLVFLLIVLIHQILAFVCSLQKYF